MGYARRDKSGRQANEESKLRVIQVNCLATYDEYSEIKDMARMMGCTITDILLCAVRETTFTRQLRRAAARHTVTEAIEQEENSPAPRSRAKGGA